MKRPYESPSMEAIRFAEEPMRGFVFSSRYAKGEKIDKGNDTLFADEVKSGTKATDKEFSRKQ